MNIFNEFEFIFSFQTRLNHFFFFISCKKPEIPSKTVDMTDVLCFVLDVDVDLIFSLHYEEQMYVQQDEQHLTKQHSEENNGVF